MEPKVSMYFDPGLQMEIYTFQGLMQPFPCHFHDYYVIGAIESGNRTLTCCGTVCEVGPGNILLFGPGESHSCTRSSGTMNYRSLNIPWHVMVRAAEIVGYTRPQFTAPVVRDQVAWHRLMDLFEEIDIHADVAEKDEQFLLLLDRLLVQDDDKPSKESEIGREEVQRAVTFMRQNYREKLTLGEICCYAGASKSTLLRAFFRETGMTPYRYLEAIRVGAAKELLELGKSPAEAAQETGFVDQSHFTGYFHRFLGVTPGKYRMLFQKNAPLFSGGTDNEP